MSDRPQYGELASPEEQRRRAQLNMPAPAAAPLPAPAVASRREQGAGRQADRIVTIVLLAYGIINVAMTIPGLLAPAASIDAALQMLGSSGSFTDSPAARAWGFAAAAVLLLSWVGTLLWAVSRLRKRRLAWWTTLVGAAVAYVLTSICLLFLMLTDPSVLELVQSTAG